MSHSKRRRPPEDERNDEARTNAAWLQEAPWGEAAAAAGVGAYSFDITSGRSAWSPKMREIHGFPSDEPFELSTDQITALVHPEDRKRYLAHIEKAYRLPEGSRYESEFRIVRPDGQIRWVRDTGVVVFSGNGDTRRPAGAAGVALDITESKQADEQLRLTNERFTTTLSAAPIIVFSQDLELRYTWIIDNPAAAFFPKDIVGLTDFAVFAPEQASRLENIKREVLQTGISRRCEMQLSREELDCWYDMTVSPQRDGVGGIVGVLCSAVDITERRHTEDMLRQRSQRLAFLSEASAELLATEEPLSFVDQLFARLSALLELDVYVHYAVSSDRAHLELAAASGLSEALEAELTRIDFDHPLCGTVARERAPLILSDRPSISNTQTSSMRSLGLTAYACHPLIAHGELFGTLAFGSTSAEEFGSETVGLLRAVSDLVALAMARHHAEQSLRLADRRKDEFLATLAHELRNPLAPIRSGVDIIRLAKDDPETIQATYPIMERQVDQLTRLVDDLLEVSRITQGRLELRKAQVDVSSVIESALDETRALIEQCGHRLVLELPEEPISLYGDRARLAQVFANLLDNAAKYTPAGGSITVHAETRSDTVVVSVEDNGLGIEPDRLDGVFDIFVRGTPHGEHAHKGLGLGLTLVKLLIEMHDGSVEVQSAGPRKGSKFIVRLPHGTKFGDALLEPGAPSSRSAKFRCRVLVVDDNEDAAKLMAQIVQMLGHEARVAFDGYSAIDTAVSFRPQLILLDIGLPELDGYAAARRIRQLPSARDALLVALTGWAHDGDRRKAIEAGFDEHFAKPMSRAVLEALLLRVSAGAGSSDRSPEPLPG